MEVLNQLLITTRGKQSYQIRIVKKVGERNRVCILFRKQSFFVQKWKLLGYCSEDENSVIEYLNIRFGYRISIL
jgi:hypothetical protein